MKFRKTTPSSYPSSPPHHPNPPTPHPPIPLSAFRPSPLSLFSVFDDILYIRVRCKFQLEQFIQQKQFNDTTVPTVSIGFRVNLCWTYCCVFYYITVGNIGIEYLSHLLSKQNSLSNSSRRQIFTFPSEKISAIGEWRVRGYGERVIFLEAGRKKKLSLLRIPCTKKPYGRAEDRYH